MIYKVVMSGVIGVVLSPLFFCTACTQDGGPGDTVKIREPIRLAYVTPEITRGTNTDIQDVSFVDGLLLGLYVDAASEVDSYTNVRMCALAGGGLQPEHPLFYPLRQTDRVSAYAYAPYQTGWDDGTSVGKTFVVSADQTTDDGVVASDLLWGRPAVNPFRTTEPVQLHFRHRLTKVMVTLEMQKKLLPVSDEITVKMTHVRRDCTIRLSTGEIAEGDSLIADTLAMARIDLADAEVMDTGAGMVRCRCCAVVVPQTIEAGHSLFLIEWPEGHKVVRQTRERTVYTEGAVVSYLIKIGEEDLM